MTKAHAALPVSEIHQQAYNNDELIAETISAIAAHIQADYDWTPQLERQLAADLDTCDRWANDIAGEDEVQPGDILADWEGIGASYGIVVIQDGDAGWTYVGYDTDAFIVNYYQDEEND